MNEPIRADKEDHYFSEDTKKTPLSPKLKVNLSKTKWIIIILVLFIVLLLLSFVIFKPSAPEPTIVTATEAETSSPTESSQTELGTIEQQSTDVTQLTPPAISRDATETKQQVSTVKERVEIPGEVADLLAEKIMQLNDKDTVKTSAQLQSQNKAIDSKYNEQLLQQTLENDHFTIQINSSSSIESLMAFAKKNQISNYQIYETRREQKPWFVLIKGNYPTNQDAKESIKGLPAELQKSKPWIKSGATINKEKQP